MEHTISQSKFWVYSTAFIMSFNGGYINAICLVSMLKIPVGYVTGNLTLAGQFVEHGDVSLFLHVIGLVLCFLIGSIVSGLVIKDEHFKIDYRYSLSIFLQLFFLMIAVFFLHHAVYQAGFILSLIMGMQNAMTTHYGTALIRTTHMTGTATDLGVLIARWIKGEKVSFWKIRLYLSLICGFLLGAIGGAFCYQYFAVNSLFFSILLYLAMLSWRLATIRSE